VNAQPAFEPPRDLDWRSWRVHTDRTTRECQCKEHTYQRWHEMLLPPRVLPASKAGEAEQARMNQKLAEVAAQTNAVFRLIPEAAWPKCKDH